MMAVAVLLPLHLDQRVAPLRRKRLHELEAAVVNRRSLRGQPFVCTVMSVPMENDADIEVINRFRKARRTQKRKNLRRFSNDGSRNRRIVQHDYDPVRSQTL